MSPQKIQHTSTDPSLPKPSLSLSQKLMVALAPWPTKKTPAQQNIKLITGSLLFLTILVLTVISRVNQAPQEIYLNWAIAITSTLMQWTLGLPFYAQVIKQWRQHGSKLILVIAALGSWLLALSQWQSSGDFSQLFITTSFILYTITLIQYFETLCLFKTGNTLQSIKDLRPKAALKKIGSDFKAVLVSRLKQGDILKIAAGQTIPLDGIILSGTTSVDESTLTGQIKPLLKGKGDSVVGATLNRDSEIIIELNKSLEDNVLQKITNCLQGSFGKKLSTFTKVERLAKTIAFIGILITAVVAYYFLIVKQDSLSSIAPTLLSILLSFSSVSLGTSIITLSNTYISKVFSKGILIKQGAMIETLAKLGTLFIDKTGTLTKGHFEYSQTFIEMGNNQGQILSTLFSLESQTDHPLGASMETHPWFYEVPKHNVSDFKTHPGLGICGTIKPKGFKEYFAATGNLRFLKRMQMYITRDMKAKMDELETMGETVLLCGFNKKVSGLMSFSDIVRPKVRETLKAIQSLGIEPAIVTGDSESDISHLTENLGIKKVYSRCTPQEKANKINKETKNGIITGFVGSGQEAYDQAHVSLDLDTGTDITNNTADVILMGSDFSNISWLLQQSKQLLRKVYVNKMISGAFIVSCASLAILGKAKPEIITAGILALNLFYLKASTNSDVKQDNLNLAQKANV